MYFIGAATLNHNTPTTALELMRSAITARTYATAQQKTDALNRLGGMSGEVFIECATDMYLLDNYKSGLVGADFTGGGAVLAGNTNRRLGNGTDLGQIVCYQASGSGAKVYFYVMGN